MTDPQALLIFRPVLALATWTVLVLMLLPLARFRAFFRGDVGWNDFQHGESARVSTVTSVPNRALVNLLEMPVLFYVACTVAVLAGQADAPMRALAWAYVALRVTHSLIHLSYNRVTHRFVVFALSNCVLAVMLARLIWSIYGRN